MCFPSIAAVLGLRVNDSCADTDEKTLPLPSQMPTTPLTKSQIPTSPPTPVFSSYTDPDHVAATLDILSHRTKQKPFRFFDLPRELRVQIYEYIYHDSQIFGFNEPLLGQTWKSSMEHMKVKHKRAVYAIILYSVTCRFRHEYLCVWAEQHTHDMKLDLDFWRRIRNKDKAPADFSMATPWKGHQLVGAKTLAEALWTQLSAHLQKIELRYGVARRIRHVVVHANSAQNWEHLADAQQPHHMVGQLAIQKALRHMQRLDHSLAHGNLVVELVVLATNYRQRPTGPFIWWPARRRAVFRQAHGLGVDGARLRAEQDWVLVLDVVEQKTFRAAPGTGGVNPAGTWEWEVSGAEREGVV
ncbi:hypothetical protein LTR78_004237 [Recurvomyces mirabilis]|uniref:Uncharacterized protein n=1 Tax=Recurvomyces mirabilis TaxID=574656 RepID=A0AAE1C2T8_9PEZI|nr:hypothetical protein LTR78_004237 [Recurvomyces mirabilis]KAK5153593.1 hypothetical protein LTS14_007287 [Recurvomyces mirabilis]